MFPCQKQKQCVANEDNDSWLAQLPAASEHLLVAHHLKGPEEEDRAERIRGVLKDNPHAANM